MFRFEREYRVPWRTAAGFMLRRTYAENAWIKSLFIHKFCGILVRLWLRKSSNRLRENTVGRPGVGGAPSAAADAYSAEALLPARQDLPVVDIVGDATLERGHHRAGGPGHALPQLAALGVGGGMG